MTQFGTVSNSTSLVWEVKTPAKDLAGNKVSGFCRLQKLLPFFLPFPQDRQPWINTKIRWPMRKRAKFSLKIATNPPLLKNQKIKVSLVLNITSRAWVERPIGITLKASVTSLKVKNWRRYPHPSIFQVACNVKNTSTGRWRRPTVFWVSYEGTSALTVTTPNQLPTSHWSDHIWNIVPPFGVLIQSNPSRNWRWSKEWQLGIVHVPTDTTTQVVLQICYRIWIGRHWESRRIKLQLIIIYKMTNGLVDIPSDPYLTPAKTRTRAHHSKKLRQYPAMTDTFKYSCFPRTILVWNSLPASVAEIPWLGTLQAGAVFSHILS